MSINIASLLTSSVSQAIHIHMNDALDNIVYSHDYKNKEDSFYLTATFSGHVVFALPDGSSETISFKFEEKYHVNYEVDSEGRELFFNAGGICFFDDDKLNESVRVFVNGECLDFDHPFVKFLCDNDQMIETRSEFVDHVNINVNLSNDIEYHLGDTVNEILDSIADSRDYNEDPYAYYGMSRSDFY